MAKDKDKDNGKHHCTVEEVDDKAIGLP